MRALWWTSSGRLACNEHVPQPGSTGWWLHRWEPMGEHEQAGFEQGRGSPPACEVCEAVEALQQPPDAAGAA